MVSAAIVWLLLSLRAATAQDYIFACFFLICTTSLLKIRFVLALSLGMLLDLGYYSPGPSRRACDDKDAVGPGHSSACC